MMESIKQHLREYSLGGDTPPAFFVLRTCYGLSWAQIAAGIGRSRSMLTYYLDGRAPVPQDVQEALKEMIVEGMEVIKDMKVSDPTHRRMTSAIWGISKTLLDEWDQLMGEGK